MWVVELVLDTEGVIWSGEYTDRRCAKSAYDRACGWLKAANQTDVLVCIRKAAAVD